MTENKKQRGMLSNLYLFTSEYENNEPVGPLDVVTNTFIFWGDPDEVDLENQGRILMRTDEVGCIHHTIETVKDFESMTGPTGKPVMDYSAPFKGMMINKYMKDGKRDDVPQPLLLPPAEAVSYIALSTPDGMRRRKGMGRDFPLPLIPSRKGRGKKGGNELVGFIKPAINYTNSVMPDLIRHPVAVWIPAFAGMTTVCIFNCRVNGYREDHKGHESVVELSSCLS